MTTLVTTTASLSPLSFDNRFVGDLPADPCVDNRVRTVTGACHSAVMPTPVAAPRLLAVTRALAEAIGFAPGDLDHPDFAAVFGGNALMPGMQPHAMRYGGHQFGSWAGQLGDGRAITLGEVVGADGARHELQLKGAGPTPYSRRADGRAVLRSSIREFLCSEAMHHLGVPTTRALSLVATGEQVMRDMFYDGNPQWEPGAVVCRVAPSFIRFGNFEIHAACDELSLLERLVDFTIARDYPALLDAFTDTGERRVAWFHEVARRTAVMVAHWMRVGFVHGVMNTDNMSILGLTIDYGPYGWIDDYDPNWTPNTTDEAMRRYRFGHQSRIAYWNLAQLANALYPVIRSVDDLKAGLAVYSDTYARVHRHFCAAKLGLADIGTPAPTGVSDGDAVEGLFLRLERLLRAARLDMTLFFLRLAELDPARPALEPFAALSYDPVRFDAEREALLAWFADYGLRVQAEGVTDVVRQAHMAQANPRRVLRNYLAQQVIDAATAGDLAPLERARTLLRRPYDAQPGDEDFVAMRPDWARHKAGCSMLSCSS